jgi:hypothetical protein
VIRTVEGDRFGQRGTSLSLSSWNQLLAWLRDVEKAREAVAAARIGRDFTVVGQGYLRPQEGLEQGTGAKK